MPCTCNGRPKGGLNRNLAHFFVLPGMFAFSRSNSSTCSGIAQVHVNMLQATLTLRNMHRHCAVRWKMAEKSEDKQQPQDIPSDDNSDEESQPIGRHERIT